MAAKRRTSVWVSLTLALTMTLGPALHAWAQTTGVRRPIIISFGQPNIWSLEQAHYLLARMRDQSLDLKTRMPDTSDLDPNESNGTRLRSLRTFLGVGVGFDQAAGLQNSLFGEDAKVNRARRQTLLANRDQLQTQLLAASDDLEARKVERETMNVNGASDAEKKLKDAEVAQAATKKTALSDNIADVDKQLGALSVQGGTLTSPTPPDAATSKLADSVADKMLGSDDFKKELANDVRLNAETVLENHIQMQYEIIAKQLTLLRDEVGPGQRLVFLELPQSFYTVPDKANRKLAQVWWHVDGFYKSPPPSPTPTPSTSPTPCATPTPSPTPPATPTPTPAPTPRMPFIADANAWYERMIKNPYNGDAPVPTADILRNLTPANFEKVDIYANWHPDGDQSRSVSESRGSQIRAVDLIPRESSLNVNDIQDQVKNFNLAGAFSFLFGLGGRIDFQRQRRLYEQYMHQDIFASAFGKGDHDFGWTFGPLPGTQRIAPGLHTTYAVLVVPDEAVAIKLTAKGCYLRRTDYAPGNFRDTDESESENQETIANASGNVECQEQKEFNIPIPGTSENNFWVTGIDYRQVKPGERAVVMVHGEYFSPQIGVLVDGVPLRKAVGVAQVEVISSHRSDAYVPEPRGEYEFVNSKELVLAFTMPKEFKGTPSIALVTPGRARVINDLRVVINKSYKDGPYKYKKLPEDPCTLEENSIWVRLDSQKPIFAADAPGVSLSIGDLNVLRINAGVATAYLTGTKFDGSEKILVNGVELGNATGSKTQETDTLYKLTFPVDDSDTWNVTVIQTTTAEGKESKTDVSKNFPNPTQLKITEDPTVLSYSPESDPPSLTVKLVGSGFTSTVRASATGDGHDIPATLSRVSMREAAVTLKSPTETVIVTLTDAVSGQSVSTIVSRPKPKEKKPKPKYRVFEGDEQGGDDSSPP